MSKYNLTEVLAPLQGRTGWPEERQILSRRMIALGWEDVIIDGKVRILTTHYVTVFWLVHIVIAERAICQQRCQHKGRGANWEQSLGWAAVPCSDAAADVQTNDIQLHNLLLSVSRGLSQPLSDRPKAAVLSNTSLLEQLDYDDVLIHCSSSFIAPNLCHSWILLWLYSCWHWQPWEYSICGVKEHKYSF